MPRFAVPESFAEVRRLSRPALPLRVRYQGLYDLLKRICAEVCTTFSSEYSGLFSQLYAVCQATGTDHRDADRLRRNARRVLAGEAMPTPAGFTADRDRMVRFIATLGGTPVPPDLRANGAETASPAGNARPVPQPDRAEATNGEDADEVVRVVITAVGEKSLVCMAAEGDSLPFAVPTDGQPEIAHQAEAGMQANLIGWQRHAGGCTTRLIVLEPDFLIDVSTLTACVKPYGSSPLHYFLSKFAPRANTAPILLGNATNQFMDDCIYHSAATPDAPAEKELYLQSIRKHFRGSQLDYVSCPDPIGPEFFAKAAEHFRHIRQTVAKDFSSPEVDIRPGDVLLEPAFLCPALGLRARLDVMTADHLRLLELKSGKADNFGRTPRPSHALQMALYKEILHFNFHIPRDAMRSFLLYSAYPTLFSQRPSAQAVSDILRLRNGIIHIESLLRKGRWADLLPSLTIEALNVENMGGPLFARYLRPALERLLRPLHHMPETDKAYFTAATTFLAREQFLSKTHDARPGSQRGFARIWTASLPEKMQAGDILTGLRILSLERQDGAIAALRLSVPDYGEDFIPDFGTGEMVQLYQRNDERTHAGNSQTIRAVITHLDEKEMCLELAYRQRNARVFPADSLYAVEKDGTDAAFTQGYRGLYSLLNAPEDRRRLWYGGRRPRTGPDLKLAGDYGTRINEIVQAACRAKDYYLLVGPPGTGKTNVALRSMVCEFLARQEAGSGNGTPAPPAGALLLTAYTHRAVDEICGMLESLAVEAAAKGQPAPAYVRIGATASCAPAFRHRLLESQTEGMGDRAAVARFLRGVPIFTGTLMTLSNRLDLFRLRRFRAAIVDEASQVLEPQMLPLFCATSPGPGGKPVPAIGKFILIGDHKQLPAVVQQGAGKAAAGGTWQSATGTQSLRRSLFERWYTQWLCHREPGIAGMLHLQGRMHPDICRFVSRHFYGDRLQSLRLPHQTGPLPIVAAPANALEEAIGRRRMVFVDVEDGGNASAGSAKTLADNPKCNAAEAEAVARLVAAIVRLHTPAGGSFDAAHRIGIIVPFRNQIGLIRTRLRQAAVPGAESITIDTVECYQGSQRDFILFSATVSRPYQVALLSEEHECEGQLVDRKLNVAITRARMQFVLVGNGRLLTASHAYRLLIDYCTQG